MDAATHIDMIETKTYTYIIMSVKKNEKTALKSVSKKKKGTIQTKHMIPNRPFPFFPFLFSHDPYWQRTQKGHSKNLTQPQMMTAGPPEFRAVP